MNKTVTKELNDIEKKLTIVKGEADNSAILEGLHNKAISQASIAVGAGNIAGLKGWYYKAVQIGNDSKVVYLYLTTEQQIPILVSTANAVENQEKNINFNISKGDICSIINGNRLIDCFEFRLNEISKYGRISFTYKGEGTNPLSIIQNVEELKLEDYSVFCISKPSYGIVELSKCNIALGNNTKSLAETSVSIGLRSTAVGITSYAEGQDTIAVGECAHAEGAFTKSNGIASHTEGFGTQTEGLSAHAEGYNTLATGGASHSEGSATIATGLHSHAEGDTTEASGEQSHAEGKQTVAEGEHSHSEGYWTKAHGKSSHVEGQGLNNTTYSVASGDYSHSEGFYTRAFGTGSHTEGTYTIAHNKGEHAEGIYNKSTENVTLHSVGIGTSANDRTNAHEITNDGKHYILNIGGYNGKNPSTSKDLKVVIDDITKSVTDLSTNTSKDISTLKTYVDTQDTSIFNQLKQLRNDIMDLDNDSSASDVALAARINDLSTNTNKAITQLRTDVSTQDNSLSNKITQLRTDVSTQDASLKTYIDNKSATESDTDNGVYVKVSTSGGNVIGVDVNTTQLKRYIDSSLTQLRTDVSTQDSSITHAIEQLKSDISNVDGSLGDSAAAINLRITNLDASVKQLRTDVSTQDNSLSNKITQLRTDVSTQDASLKTYIDSSLNNKFNITGGTISGKSTFVDNIILYNNNNASGEGATPALEFRRGNNTSFNDWRYINDSGGGFCLETRKDSTDNSQEAWTRHITHKHESNDKSINIGTTSLAINLNCTGDATANTFRSKGSLYAYIDDASQGLYLSNAGIRSHIKGTYKRSLLSFGGNLDAQESDLSKHTDVVFGKYCRLSIGWEKYPDKSTGTDNYGLDCKNSDVIGVNSLVFNNTAENATEGILFKIGIKEHDNHCGIWVNGSQQPKFSQNVKRLTNDNGTDYDIFWSNASLIPYKSGSISIGSSSKKFQFGYFSESVSSAGFYQSSDNRLKTFGDTIPIDLEKLSKIKKNYFTWNNNDDNNIHIGVSAQEIQEIYPELVNTDNDGMLSVAYDKLSVIALAAIDKLYIDNKTLENKIKTLESKLELILNKLR